MMYSGYVPPVALTAIAGVFLGIGAILMVVVLFDMIVRQGWKSMMLIMIPVYPINAGYMPLSLYVYYKYGRPPKPGGKKASNKDNGEVLPRAKDLEKGENGGNDDHRQHHAPVDGGDTNTETHMHHGTNEHGGHHEGHNMEMDHSQVIHPHMVHSQMDHSQMDHSQMDHSQHQAQSHNAHAMHNMHAPSPDRPMWATVAVGVMHCGAGCVLGDLVGEWLVFGTGVTINGADIWPCLLIDYAFALLFGIAFQYFSIAPMSGEYGPKTIWRAAKADILSLTFFEIGLFGWMVIYQVGIWGYRLSMDTWVYWWMMQVGMFFGFFTAFPVNWWLITRNIKEPCA